MDRNFLACLLVACQPLGCDIIAGYDDVEPWPAETGLVATNDASDVSQQTEVDVTAKDAAADDAASRDVSTRDTMTSDRKIDDVSVSDMTNGDVTTDQGPTDADAGPCTVLTGGDACANVPHFTAATQVVDGIGDEFCDIPAMVFEVKSCPTIYPQNDPPPMPEKVLVRIAWSDVYFHLHIHVVDPKVIVNPDPGNLWSGDAVEIYIAGTSDLHGSYNGTNDGGAIQIVLAPPAGGLPTRGQAFFNPGGTTHTSAPINDMIYAGRIVADGYELELQLPWVAFAPARKAGNKIGFDLAVDAQQDPDAGGRQTQCIFTNKFADGKDACGYAMGSPAQPWCEDRSWCTPTLLP
jgi:hypothetical protein